jgi:predicted acetyltransferase
MATAEIVLDHSNNAASSFAMKQMGPDGAGAEARSLPMIAMELIPPDQAHLPFYVAALQAGWSPNTTRDVSAEECRAIAADADGFLRDLQRTSPSPRTLPDGRVVHWLPGRTFWMWDGAFCGSINLRYQLGTEDLPPHVSGHVGYAVVPWKQRRGYARQALHMLLPVAREIGLARVLVTCDDDNVASRRVIESNGGVLAGAVPNPDRPYGRKLCFWIATG